jgi:hypothetical protein
VDSSPAQVRTGRSPRDMALSLAVILLPVFLLVGLFRALGHEDPPSVDAAPAYDAARRADAFPVLEAAGLPDDWHVQSATFRLGVLRIGLRTPDKGGAQVIQTNQPADRFVPAQLGNEARADGTVDVNGRPWQRYTGGRKGQRALVLLEPDRTVILIGQTSEAALRTLAASLR